MKKMIIAMLLAPSASIAFATPDLTPDALARSVTDEIQAIVQADKELRAGQQQKVAQLVESKVLPHFNFARMTQLAVGRNWRHATPDQQKILVDEFKGLLVRTYASAFAQYRNQSIDYRPVHMAPGDTDVVVKSLIKQPSGQPVGIDYRMEKLDGAWKIYDVRIEGISLVENYRNTFNSEIQRSGVDGLIKALAEKNKALAAQAAR